MSEKSSVPPAFLIPALARQMHTVRMLSHSQQTGQLSHAYLLKGPVPMGLALALALAKSLFCPQGGCNTCHVCLAVAAEQHPDLHVLRGEGEGQHPTLKLAQIKHLVEQVGLPPTQSSHQLFILVQAENLNKESSNALLKTLEEPASNSIILLLTPLLERILPTIRSRAQILALTAPMPDTTSLAAQAPERSFWQWEELEKIQTPALLGELQEQLEGLNPADLSLQLQIFQRGCWNKIQAFIVEKRSLVGLKRAYAYLTLFEDAIAQLRANVNPKLVASSLSYGYLGIRRGRS